MPGGAFQGWRGWNRAITGANVNGLGVTQSGRQTEKSVRPRSEVKGLHNESTRNGRVMGAEGGVGRPQWGVGARRDVNGRSVEERSGGGRCRERSAAVRDRAKSCSGEKGGAGKGGCSASGTRRGDWDRRGERRGGSVHPPDRDRAPKGPKLGYKKLEELCEEEPSVVAFTLSSHPAIKELLSDREMRKDLVHLVCQVLSKALTSRTERATKQHLANIVKDSEFFRTTLLYSLAGMESESEPASRARHPQLLGNVLAIQLEVCIDSNAVEITTE